MKTTSLLITGLALVAGVTGSGVAAESATSKVEKKSNRETHRNEDRGPKEPRTFLGVHVVNISDTLTSQLGLDEGVGLVVRHVAPDSPAAGAIQLHDVLVKLDDQLLIDVRQLAVLIQSKKAGDEAALKLLRKGAEQTVRVKLVQRDLPKPGPKLPGFEEGRVFPFHGPVPPGVRGFGFGTGQPEDPLRVMRELHSRGPGVRIFRKSGDDVVTEKDITVFDGNRGRMTFSDDAGALEITMKDGKKSLEAKDEGGKIVFTGPIDSPEDRAKLPEAVRARLEKVEAMDNFSFSTDEDFQGVRTRRIPSDPLRIHFPAPVAKPPGGASPVI